MERNEKMLKEIEKLHQKYEEGIYSKDLTSEDIQSFKKVLYHLKKDVPELDMSHIDSIVNEIYKIKPIESARTVNLTENSERRKKIKEEHQKRLDIVAKIAGSKK